VTLCILAALAIGAEENSITVKEGETLFSIAKKSRVPTEILCSFNGITDPGKLKTGTVIRFPEAYMVKKGDTLYGIARSAGIPVARLMLLNGLTSASRIKKGDRIFLPPGSKPSSPAQPQEPPETKVSQAPQETAIKEPPQSSEGLLLPHLGKREPFQGKISGIIFHGVRGDPVHSAAGGEVKWVGPYWGWGKTVIIRSSDGTIFLYAGNEELLVNVGDRVSAGSEIARLGVSPQDGGAKLYFSIQGAKGQFMDPEKLFSGKNRA
jgi:lipoprotein YgeR